MYKLEIGMVCKGRRIGWERNGDDIAKICYFFIFYSFLADNKCCANLI